MDIQLPGNLLLSGSTGSGKSTWMAQLLHELKPQYDVLVLMSPTLEYNDDFGDWPDDRELARKQKRPPRVLRYTSGFVQAFQTLVAEQKELFRRANNGDIKRDAIPRVFFVLDDVAGTPIMRMNGVVDKFALRARHLRISIAMLVQRLMAVPRQVRLQVKYAFVFTSFQFSDVDKYLSEFLSRRARKDVLAAIEEHLSKKYAFVFADNTKTRLEDRILLVEP